MCFFFTKYRRQSDQSSSEVENCPEKFLVLIQMEQSIHLLSHVILRKSDHGDFWLHKHIYKISIKVQ